MPLSNQPEPNRPIPRDDLRNTLLIIEKGKEYKDSALLKSILNVAFYMPSSNHMLYEYLQIYQGGIQERLLSSKPETYLYDTKSMLHAKKELYRRAYGDFKEAMWLLEQDLKGVIHHYQRDFYSDIIQPKYFTAKQRKLWKALTKRLVSASKPAHANKSEEAKQALDALRSTMQDTYGALIATPTGEKLFEYEIKER